MACKNCEGKIGNHESNLMSAANLVEPARFNIDRTGAPAHRARSADDLRPVRIALAATSFRIPVKDPVGGWSFGDSFFVGGGGGSDCADAYETEIFIKGDYKTKDAKRYFKNFKIGRGPFSVDVGDMIIEAATEFATETFSVFWDFDIGVFGMGDPADACKDAINGAEKTLEDEADKILAGGNSCGSCSQYERALGKTHTASCTASASLVGEPRVKTFPIRGRVAFCLLLLLGGKYKFRVSCDCPLGMGFAGPL